MPAFDALAGDDEMIDFALPLRLRRRTPQRERCLRKTASIYIIHE